MPKQKALINSIIIALLLTFTIQTITLQLHTSRNNLTGTVYAATGIPIVGATVVAIGPNGFGTAVTDGNGRYNITQGLKNGTYIVTVTKQGYLIGEDYSVVVTAPYQTSGVDFYLNLSGAIAGTVIDNATEFGIPNVDVTALSINYPASYYGSATTDLLGNYEINTNLGTDSYNVSVMMPKGYTSKTIGPVTVTAGSKTSGVNVVLRRSGIVSGRITTPNGQPLADIAVNAFSLSGGFGSALTNASGNYKITSGLVTGNYTIIAISGLTTNTTTANVTEDQETPNVDLQLDITAPLPSGIIMGRVTDSTNEQPIDAAHVSAIGQTTSAYGEAYTNSSGDYIISQDLETDNYTVSVTATGYQDANLTNINVTAGQVIMNINFQMNPIPPSQSGIISGTVTGDTNPIPELETPITIMMIITLITLAITKTCPRKTKHP